MILNKECLRDLLLYVEQNCTYDTPLHTSKFEIAGYSHDDMVYATEKLIEAGYLKVSSSIVSEGRHKKFLITAITYKGHLFLDNIRPQDSWDKTKSLVAKIGSASLEVMASTAAQVATSLITKVIGL